MARIPEPETLEEARQRAAISVPAAGRLMSLGKNAAWAAAHRGEIPTRQYGRRILVPVPEWLRSLGDDGRAAT